MRLDNIDGLVASYSIDRGRQFEDSRTDGGRATVQINDRDGILDPTNVSGDYWGEIQPLVQVALGRWNPVAEEWKTRFRGYISDWDYSFDPSQRVNRLTLSLVDIYEVLNAIQMLPGFFGDTPPTGSEGQVFFDNAGVGPIEDESGRILQVLGNAGIPDAFSVVFSGNVQLYETVYSPGESVMTVIQESADAEFPGGLANVYPDRYGRLVFHGRRAKFTPQDVADETTTDVWDFHHWHCGDGTAVAASPTDTAHIRRFAFNLGLSKIINQALATPINIDDADVTDQIYFDADSIATYGIRSWTAQNLLTKTDTTDSADALVATKRFATYYVNNYAIPRNRITDLGFRSMRPGATGAAANWRLLCECDISDLVGVTISSPGGGVFDDEDFFIEGIHETSEPLNPGYDNVTMTLDVSPAAYYANVDDVFPPDS